VAKNLVIVESPAKAKTIQKYLGKSYSVKASVGHVKDLPKKTLGVDLENDFQPSYQVISGKKKVIQELKKAAQNAEQIYLASDPDREGEAIAWHIAEELSKKPGKKSKKTVSFDDRIHRVMVNEITKPAIQAAIAAATALDEKRYNAQQARRILDRLVGYQISPVLWEKVRRGLSAGRVQSVALRLICEREQAIRAFIPVEYWSLHAVLLGSVPPAFEAKLAKINRKKAALRDEKETAALVDDIKTKPFVLKEISKKERKRHPAAPFITSTLQQEAARKLGFTAKRTMGTAQGLYEGIELEGEEVTGLITYMRTDSTRIGDEALKTVRGLITSKYGKDYLPAKPNVYKSKKGAQDAHEAIRPTNPELLPDELKNHLSRDQFRLYELIWKRFVASQMSSAIIDQTTLIVEAGSAEFRCSGSVIRFAGFLTLYIEGADDDASASDLVDGQLPDLKEGETLDLKKLSPEQHFTEPPPRFTEASLIKHLEENGIGRPSTYAAILSNIEDRNYVTKENKRFFASELGLIVNELLVENFPNIMDVAFTARMEDELDDVETGKRTMIDAINDFFIPFSKNLELAKTNMRNVKAQEIPTELLCKKCQSPMVIKWGRRGEFVACSAYPECKFTGEFTRDDEGRIHLAKQELTDEVCSECKSPMIVKTGRFGKFLACSKYPQCKNTASFHIGVDCPACDGKLVERRSKRGKIFFGCNAYPKCTFASWNKPIAEKCPLCSSKHLTEKTTKKEGTVIVCPEKECGYSREAAE
jgi:DNA topoisomerase I